MYIDLREEYQHASLFRWLDRRTFQIKGYIRNYSGAVVCAGLLMQTLGIGQSSGLDDFTIAETVIVISIVLGCSSYALLRGYEAVRKDHILAYQALDRILSAEKYIDPHDLDHLIAHLDLLSKEEKLQLCGRLEADFYDHFRRHQDALLASIKSDSVPS